MDPNKYYYEERETLKNWGKFLDDSHEIIFDLNDENNYGFLEKRKINANIRL